MRYMRFSFYATGYGRSSFLGCTHICSLLSDVYKRQNEYIAKEPVKDGSVLMNSIYCLPEYYLVEESSPTSAGNHEWFMKMFCKEFYPDAEKEGISVYQLGDRLAEQVDPSEQNIIFLPYLYGSNSVSYTHLY